MDDFTFIGFDPMDAHKLVRARELMNDDAHEFVMKYEKLFVLSH